MSDLRLLLAWRWAPLLVMAALGVVYAVTMAVHQVPIDVLANDLNAQQLATTGHPWLEHAHVDLGYVPFPSRTAAGHLVSVRTPGQIWAAVPAYTWVNPASSSLAILPGSLTAALLCAVGMGFFFAGLRAVVDPFLAVLGTLVAGLGTPVWTVAADALYTHSLTTLGLGVVVWGSARGGGWAAGTGSGIAMLARPHVGLVALVQGLHAAWQARSWRPLAAYAVPPLVALSLTAWWGRVLLGHATVNTYDRPYHYLAPGAHGLPHGFLWHLAAFLLSPSRGLLVWTPLLVVAGPLVVRGWRRRPPALRSLAYGGLAYLVAQVSLNIFSGGTSFYGYRLAIEPVLCLLPVVVASLPEAGRRTRLDVALAIAYQAAAIAIGAPGDSSTHDVDFMGSRDSALAWWPNSAFHLVTGSLSYAASALVVGGLAYVTTRGLLRATRAEVSRA